MPKTRYQLPTNPKRQNNLRTTHIPESQTHSEKKQGRPSLARIFFHHESPPPQKPCKKYPNTAFHDNQ